MTSRDTALADEIDTEISPELQKVIDETKAKIAEAFDGMTPVLARLRRTAAPKMQGRDGWLLIETAPKDGTAILTWDGQHVRLAHWNARFDSEWSDAAGDVVYEGAWTDGSVVDWGMQVTERHNPTHWRPLPTAPDLPTEEA